jgi:hypothetical protein
MSVWTVNYSKDASLEFPKIAIRPRKKGKSYQIIFKIPAIALDLLGCPEEFKHEKNQDTSGKQELLRWHLSLFQATKTIKN